MALVTALVLAAVAPASATPRAVDSFYAARGVFCLVQRHTDTRVHEVDCIVDHRLFALRTSGRARARSVGDGDGGDVPHIPYEQWYVVVGNAVQARARRDSSSISCIARRGTGLRCVNRDNHGFTLGGVGAPGIV